MFNFISILFLSCLHFSQIWVQFIINELLVKKKSYINKLQGLKNKYENFSKRIIQKNPNFFTLYYIWFNFLNNLLTYVYNYLSLNIKIKYVNSFTPPLLRFSKEIQLRNSLWVFNHSQYHGQMRVIGKVPKYLEFILPETSATLIAPAVFYNKSQSMLL